MRAVAIRAAMLAGAYRVSAHARTGMLARTIVDEELIAAFRGADLLEDYPTDPRGPSALALGYTASGRPLHAVAPLTQAERCSSSLCTSRCYPGG